jgi:hypothetical protein
MQVFFAFGYNKSGTTYLQQLLDAHPKANCPPEHHLNSVVKDLQDFLKRYRAVIQMFDERTARQGLRYNENHVFQHAMRGFISGFITDGARPGTTHFGLNDNSMWLNLPFFAAIFPTSRFIGMVRDPRAVAVSLYNHRLRTESKFEESGITLSQVAKGVGKAWASCMMNYEKFAAAPALAQRFCVTRYEDLAGPEKASALSRVYTFLGLDADSKIVEKALAENDFSSRKAKAGTGAGFLRSGSAKTWRTELSADDVAAVEAGAGHFLAMHGYAPFDATARKTYKGQRTENAAN